MNKRITIITCALAVFLLGFIIGHLGTIFGQTVEIKPGSGQAVITTYGGWQYLYDCDIVTDLPRKG